MMKHRKLFALLLAACMVLSILPAIASAEEEVYYTLDGTLTGGSNGYATESDITQNGLTWKVTGNTTMNPWRIGGKNLTEEDRPIYSTTPMNETVTKVEVDVGTVTLSKVNSLTLVVASDVAFETRIDEIVESSVTADSTITFTPTGDADWTNAYYKFVFNVNAGGSNSYIQFKAARFYKGETGEQPTTYSVSFDANGGTGTMDPIETTGSVTLPQCTFTAPDGYGFAGWKTDGDDTVYAAGATVTVAADTTFAAQWSLYTDMMLKRVPADGDVVVIYYPTAGKVMTGTDYYYNNKKHELASVSATLTDDVLAVPEAALRLTVSVDEDDRYTFATADGRYLEADGTNVQLVSAQGANTLFRLETAAAGTDNWYIKCDSATYNGNAQYLEYYSDYFTVYGLGSDTTICTFQFFSEDGEGPTPVVTYTVSFDANGGTGTMEDVTDATSPYTLPACAFTAPEGMKFAGWQMAGYQEIYAAGAQVALEEPNVTFIAQWKELVTKSYTLVTSADELTEGDTVIVVGVNGDKAYALAQQWSNNRRAVEIALEDGKAIVDVDLIATEKVNDYLVRELTIGGNAEDGWTFLDPLEVGYLYAASSEKNYLRTQEENDDNGVFMLTFGEGGAIEAVAQGTNTHNIFRFNKNDVLFSCYTSGQLPIYLYKLVEKEPEALADGFYLIGPDWTVEAIDAENVFGENLNVGGEYLLSAALAEGAEIKVVKIENGVIAAWYPDGLNTQYTVDEAHAGDVTIYFRETYNSDWASFGGYFYISRDYSITCEEANSGLISTAEERAAVGTTIRVNIDPEEGYELDTLTVMCGETAIETTKVSDDVYTFVMPAGDVTITATFRAKTPSFRTVSLLLSGQIGVKFHMDLPTSMDFSDSYMTFTIPHGPVTERAELDGDSFTCFVNAIQMGEPITATFHYGDGQAIEMTYAVKDYFTAFDMAVNNGTITDEYQIALAHSVADYGHYVLLFQAGVKGWTLPDRYALMDKFYTESYDIDAIKDAVADCAIRKSIEGEDITAITHSLIVDSETAIKVYFKVASGYKGAFTVTLDGETYTAKKSGTKYVVEIGNIPASRLSEAHVIAVTTDNGSANVTVSGMSYVKSMLDAYDTDAAKNAAAAIYSYAMAAEAYLNN